MKCNGGSTRLRCRGDTVADLIAETNRLNDIPMSFTLLDQHGNDL